MRKLFALFSAAAIVGSMVAMPAPAQADDDEGTLCSYCWEKGSFTEENPEASQILLFPVRVTSAVVGAPIGALKGLADGTEMAVQGTVDATFGNIPTTEHDPITNVTYTIVKTPFLVPAGIVGTILAVPVGMTTGVVSGTFKGIAKGYMWPDTF